MNTHDIELPPLLPSVKDCAGTYEDYSSAEMVEYARAAIEADRKRRGEPVGRFTGRFVMEPDGSKALFVVEAYGAIPGPGAELFLAPQPAEPCVAPMSDKPVCGAQNGKCETQPAEPVNDKPFCFANINKQGDVTRTSKKRDGWAKTPLYLQPQPAEPVKVPSDAAILEVWQPYRDFPVDWICQFARALLARYTTTKEQP